MSRIGRVAQIVSRKEDVTDGDGDVQVGAFALDWGDDEEGGW